MARRTTVVLSEDEDRALALASRAEGISQSELIRKGIRMVTSPYRRRKPSVGWLRLDAREEAEIRSEDFGDEDS